MFFGTVNSESEIELSEQFGVRSIPTLIIIKDGTIIYDEAGCIPEYAFKNIVEKARTIDPDNIT